MGAINLRGTIVPIVGLKARFRPGPDPSGLIAYRPIGVQSVCN